MAQEIFKVKNISGDVLEIRDFGILLDNDVTVDLGNYDLAVLSDEINGMLLNSELVRIVDDVEITDVNNIYTVSAHTHPTSNITDLVEYSGFTNYYLNTDIDTLLSSKTDSGTSYTKSETDTLLNTKANTSTTLSGYGITDAQPLDSDLTAIATLSGTSGLLKKTATDTWTLDTTAYTTNLGTVTSVGGTGTVSGLSLSGTITTSGNLTLGGTLDVTASNFASQTANTVLIAPNGVAGVPTFRVLVANDIPSLDWSKITTGKPTTLSGYGITDAQPLDGDLTAIAALSGTSGTLKKTAVNTWILDTSSSSGTVTSVSGTGTVSGLSLSGTVTTSGSLTLSGTLAVTASNFASQTANTVLIAPDGSNGVPTFRVLSANDIPSLSWSKITTGTPTTLTGYGITDAQPLDADLTAISGLVGTTGLLKKTAADTWTLDTTAYTTNLGTVTSVGGTGTVSGLSLSGSVTTSGNLTLGGTLSVTPSNFASQTANTILSAPNGTTGVPTFRLLVENDIPSLSWSKITSGTPTTLSGYGITDAATSTHTHTFASLTSKPTTLSGYGITDAQPLDDDLTAIASLIETTGLLRKTATNTWSLDTTAYTTNLGTVTSVGGTGTVSGLSLSGTVTTSGNLTLSGTLSVTPSNFASQTANTVLIAPNGSAGVPTFRLLVANDIPSLDWSKITTGKPTTLSGYGITDAYTKTETDTLLNAKLNLSGGTVTGILNISNATASTTTTNGALVVTGGVGIGGTLNVGGNSTITGSSYLGNVTTDVNQQNFTVIDITTKKLANSGTKFNVYGSEYQLASSLTSTTTTSATPVAKVTMTTTNLPSGTYKITTHWVWSRNSAANSARFNVTIGGVAQGTRNPMEVEAGDTTDIRSETLIYYVALSGVNTIIFNHWCEVNTNSTTTSDATIELIRVV